MKLLRTIILWLALTVPALAQIPGWGPGDTTQNFFPDPCGNLFTDINGTPGGTSQIFSDSTRTYIAAGFTNTTACTICKIVAHNISKNGSPTMNISISIYSSLAGLPNAIVGTGSATVSASTLPSSLSDFTFTGLSATLSANTLYYVVIQADATDGSNNVNWKQQTVTGPSSYKSANGLGWTFLAGNTSYQNSQYGN